MTMLALLALRAEIYESNRLSATRDESPTAEGGKSIRLTDFVSVANRKTEMDRKSLALRAEIN